LLFSQFRFLRTILYLDSGILFLVNPVIKIAHFRPNGYFFFTFVGHSDLLYFDPNFSGTATMFNSLVSTLMLAQTLGYSVDFYSDYTDGNGYHRVTALDIHP